MTTRQMRVPDVKKPRLLAGRFSRAERRRQRAKISLDEAALTYKTQVRYYTALRKMITFVEQARNEDHLDTLLCNWIRKMWYKGEPLLTIGDGLSALHFSSLGPGEKFLTVGSYSLFGEKWKSQAGLHHLHGNWFPVWQRMNGSTIIFKWLSCC